LIRGLPLGHNPENRAFGPSLQGDFQMRYHAIDCEMQCPHCGRGNALSYASSGVRGDLYLCNACYGRAVHRRQDGGRMCGLTPLLDFGRYGAWQACRAKTRPASPGAREATQASANG
jgi:hypothetical protein